MNDYFQGFSNAFMMKYPSDLNDSNYQNTLNEHNILKEKFNKQAGDNMNFNKCNFNSSTKPAQLYDVYNGFIRGNMFPNLFNQYKISRPFDIRPLNEQAELLTKVDAYTFAAHDVNLYLDTHPDDKEMVELFNQYSGDAKTARDEFENKFGPLLVNSKEGFPWAWNNRPWPWEN